MVTKCMFRSLSAYFLQIGCASILSPSSSSSTSSLLSSSSFPFVVLFIPTPNGDSVVNSDILHHRYGNGRPPTLHSRIFPSFSVDSLSICLSVCLSICLSVSLYVCLYASHTGIVFQNKASCF